MQIKSGSPSSNARFDQIKPRSISASVAADFERKVAAANPGILGSDLAGAGGMAGQGILRNPSRRFYDPEFSTTAIFLPKNRREINRWCRYFYDHDEIVGAVLDLHSELPHSRAEIMCSDSSIKKKVEECLDTTQFFSKLPPINLEFLKIGEVFIHTPFDESTGLWKDIIIHNPDFVEVSASPFADDEYVIELIPDEQLKKLINSTKPQDMQLKKRLPESIVRRVLSGKNIPLNNEEITHIARKSNPYDMRGKSILGRLFRLLMYEDKLREAQITIADNFIYPLKIFKLGDRQNNWVPDESHQAALASMLQQANFDPNFALIYHFGLEVDYVTVADKIMKLDNEWDEINKKKMMALGVSQEFLTGGSTYASANVGLQTQLARYKATRDLFEVRWIQNKFLRGLAEKNEWYTRDKKEIIGHYRIARTGADKEARLLIPKFVWHKKLMLRDDQAFLTFLNNVYSQGKGPVSALTLLQYMGIDLEDELARKKLQVQLENKIGVYIQPPGGTPSSAMPPAPGTENKQGPVAAVAAKVLKKLGISKVEKTKEAEEEDSKIEPAQMGTTSQSELLTGSADKKDSLEVEDSIESKSDLKAPEGYSYSLHYDPKTWNQNLNSPYLDVPVVSLLKGFDELESYPDKKARLEQLLNKLYQQGKLYSYSKTKFIPYNVDIEQPDWTDTLILSEIHNWLSVVLGKREDQDLNFKQLGLNAYSQGQLKGFQEQGINEVIITNNTKRIGQRYSIKNLLNLGSNLAQTLSSNFEVPVFIPIIQGNVTVDSQIQPTSNFYVNTLKVENCPIEIVDEMKSVVNFLVTLYPQIGKKLFKSINFVDDVVNTKEWETSVRTEAESSLPDTGDDQKLKTLLLDNKVYQTKIQNKGFLPIYETPEVLYISKWILNENKSIIKIILDSLNYISDKFLAHINSSFDTSCLDLSEEEIDTYKMLGVLQPSIYNDISCYLLDDQFKKESLDSKLVEGKMWDKQGKCLVKNSVNPSQLFQENIEKWVVLPHTLSPMISQFFSKVFKK